MSIHKKKRVVANLSKFTKDLRNERPVFVYYVERRGPPSHEYAHKANDFLSLQVATVEFSFPAKIEKRCCSIRMFAGSFSAEDDKRFQRC